MPERIQQMSALLPDLSGAVFSPCRRYRYKLWRVWDESKPLAVFCLMNCSDANEVDNDPTVERQQRRTMMWAELFADMPKVGGVMVINAFAWIETKSTKLKALIAAGEDIIGPENDQHIVDAVSNAAIVVCGWGIPGHNLLNRGAAVLKLIRDAGAIPHALKINADGSPQHPLYLGYDIRPVPMP